MLLGHRYYDPNTGRFLTRDPIGCLGGINLYAYCKNNPVNWVDPLGFCGKQAGDEEWDYAMEMDRFRRDIPRLYAQTLLDQDKQMVLNTLPGVLGPLGEANAALSPMRAIKATQPIAPGTATIPQSFVLELESGNIWVHPNAVKHLLELVGHASQKPLAEQLLLDDLVNAVRIATGQGIPYGKRIVIEGMELIFSKPREAGLLPVLKHARRIF